MALAILMTAFLVRRFVGKTAGLDGAIAQWPAEQRITSNPPEASVRCAIVSPDGRQIAYSDPNGLYLREIGSGETRPLVVPKDFEASPTSWFPDGTHLLVRRVEGQGPTRTPSIWKLSLTGGEPQKLVDNAAGRGRVSRWIADRIPAGPDRPVCLNAVSLWRRTLAGRRGRIEFPKDCGVWKAGSAKFERQLDLPGCLVTGGEAPCVHRTPRSHCTRAG